MNTFQKIEKYIASVKFAVIIILLFAISLIVGTFIESYHGTDFANRLIYKSFPFMLLQFCMFISILWATLFRLPIKKHLHGFYVLHAGLLMLFIGSFVTYTAGVDGNITLPPNTPSSQIVIPKDVLNINIYDENKNQLGSYTYKLPYNAFSTNLDIDLLDNISSDVLGDLKGTKLIDFIPFATKETKWVTNDIYPHHGSTYQLYNDMFSENLTFGLHEKSDFPSTSELGPLTIHYMPEGLAKCFSKNDNDSNYIIWDMKNLKCYPPKNLNAKTSKTKGGREFLVFKEQGAKEYIQFFPDFSPIPVNEKLALNTDSPYRILSKKKYLKLNLSFFLFGKFAAFFDKNEKIWIAKEFKATGDIIELPWMGFRIKLTGHFDNQYPMQIPVPTKPVFDNGKIVIGDLKSIKIKKDENIFYVTNEKPVGIKFGNRQIDLIIDLDSIKLPFEMNLTQFKMQTDPGTNNPASYESYTNLFTGDESINSHIYMNNPLKYKNFTFYQASYFKTSTNDFGSVLSVNFDPGRWLKYLGSLLLVFGSIWHFLLRKIKTKKVAL